MFSQMLFRVKCDKMFEKTKIAMSIKKQTITIDDQASKLFYEERKYRNSLISNTSWGSLHASSV